MISIFLSYPSIYQILIANGNDFSVQKGSLIPANLRRLAMAMANQGFFSATRKGRIQGFLGRGEGREWSANCSPKICQSECKSLRNLHFEQISFNWNCRCPVPQLLILRPHPPGIPRDPQAFVSVAGNTWVMATILTIVKRRATPTYPAAVGVQPTHPLRAFICLLLESGIINLGACYPT